MLESINVEAYGSKMSLSLLATITARNANLLHVRPHDSSLNADVKRAIDGSGLGLNAIISGDSVSVPIPKTSKETRENLAKVAATIAEKVIISTIGVPVFKQHCRRK
jgi:ribosome recycling factor